MQLVIFN